MSARTDAFIVPGGGLDRDGSLPAWVQARFDRVLELRTDEYVVALSAGTVHRPPPLDAQGYPIFESVAGARYLAARGVPPDRILVETASYDTIGNAWFARVLHGDPRAWRRLTIVNSRFHMPRTEAIFRFVFGLESPGYELDFEATSDATMPPSVLAARERKEAEALASFRRLALTIRTLSELHNWLYTQHGAYAARDLSLERTRRVDPKALESY